jgi:addiction module HigA family antidote
MRVTVAQAARELRISRQWFHRVLAEKAPVTAEMAVRLGKFCGNGPDLWLRMQQQYDVWQAEQALGPILETIPTRQSAA